MLKSWRPVNERDTGDIEARDAASKRSTCSAHPAASVSRLFSKQCRYAKTASRSVYSRAEPIVAGSALRACAVRDTIFAVDERSLSAVALEL